MSLSISDNEREHWNRKYRETPGSWLVPDRFLLWAFPEYILPRFPHGGSALDLAGGAGRHAIWLAKQGWEVTLIDISETGVEQARQSTGPLASHIHFVVDDLTHFKAAQTHFDGCKETGFKETGFGVVMAFFYLQREIINEVVAAVRPGGLLVYKTYLRAQAKLPRGPKNPEHMLDPSELLQLAAGLKVLHHREEVAEKATAELVARREV
ncbi:MAG: class I SAM-dependent methyltransferase [Terriglobales bacterium]